MASEPWPLNVMCSVAYVAASGTVSLADLAKFQHDLPHDEWGRYEPTSTWARLPTILAWDTIVLPATRNEKVSDILKALLASVRLKGLRKPRAELIRDLEYAIAHGLDLESIEGSLEFARTTLGVRLSLHKKNARGYRATLARCVHESSFVGHGQTHEAVKKLREVLRGFNRHQSFEMVGGLSEAAAVLVANGDHLEYLDCGIALVSNIRGAPHRLFLRTSMVKSEICEFLGIRVGAIRMATQEPPNFSTPSAARRELEELAERGGLH